MGAVGDSIEVSGDGDREALHAAIWSSIESFLEMLASGAAYKQVWSYLGENISYATDDGLWGVAGDSLRFTFKDNAGLSSRSASVWIHWTQLALASEWEHLSRIAEEHDLVITSDDRTLATYLTDGPGFVSLRGNLWSVEEDGISADDPERIPLSDLTDEERASVAAARTRCMCGPCSMLQPTPSIEANLLAALSNVEAASSAAWYITRWSRTSPAILTALITAPCDDMLREAIESHAPRVTDAWHLTTALLPTLHGAARARSLYALASLPLDDTKRAALLQHVRDSLADSLAAEAAVEVAGLVGRGDIAIADQIAAILDRDASDELRHQAVLGLVNLHLDRKPTDAVRSRLEREAALDTEAGKLAQWFLSSF